MQPLEKILFHANKTLATPEWVSNFLILTALESSTDMFLVRQKAEGRWEFSFAGFLETLIVTCSDQQVFTGAAYALTLRYTMGEQHP